MSEPVDRILLPMDSGERRVVDPNEVYYLEVLDEATRVRLRACGRCSGRGEAVESQSTRKVGTFRPRSRNGAR